MPVRLACMKRAIQLGGTGVESSALPAATQPSVRPSSVGRVNIAIATATASAAISAAASATSADTSAAISAATSAATSAIFASSTATFAASIITTTTA